MDTLSSAIRAKRFETTRRGYTPGEVDAFLTELGEAVETLERALHDEMVRGNELQRKLGFPKEAEQAVQAAYVAAAEAKHQMIADAEAKAAEILGAAEREAARLLDEPRREAERARQSAENVLLQAQARLDAAAREALRIEQEAEEVLAKAEAEAEVVRRRAEEEAADTIAAARREGDDILARARQDALATMSETQQEAEELLAATRAEHEELARRLLALKTAVADVLGRGREASEALRVVLDGGAEVAVGTATIGDVTAS